MCLPAPPGIFFCNLQLVVEVLQPDVEPRQAVWVYNLWRDVRPPPLHHLGDLPDGVLFQGECISVVLKEHWFCITEELLQFLRRHVQPPSTLHLHPPAVVRRHRGTLSHPGVFVLILSAQKAEDIILPLLLTNSLRFLGWRQRFCSRRISKICYIL